MIIDSIFHAMEHKPLITVKPNAAMKYDMRVDKSLDAKPVIGIMITSAMR